MAKDFTIDYSAFEKKARMLAKKLGADEREFVKDQTGLLAREVAKMTPPYAGAKLPSLKVGSAVGSKADIVDGEWAIYNDIKKICIIQKDKDKLERAKKRGGPIYGRGNRVIAPGVINSVSEYHKWHKSQKRGWGRTRDLKVPLLPWVSPELFEEYAKIQMKFAGRAKASFWKASLGLRAKSAATPKIKRHLESVHGRGYVTKTAKGSVGHIEGRAGGLAHTFRHIPELKRNRLKKAVIRGEYLMKKAAKDSNFKVV